jgi:hypothetical protein
MHFCHLSHQSQMPQPQPLWPLSWSAGSRDLASSNLERIARQAASSDVDGKGRYRSVQYSTGAQSVPDGTGNGCRGLREVMYVVTVLYEVLHPYAYPGGGT